MENQNESVKISKRIIAYLLDIILLVFIISLITSIRFINPVYDKYIDSYNKYSSVMEDYYDNKIDVKEMINLSKGNFYYVTKYSISYNIAIIVVICAYFVIFQKYNNGQTIGKKIMKIKVIDLNNDKVSLLNYFLRSLCIYYIYIGNVISLIINSILVYILNPSNYMIINLVISYFFLILSFIILLSILIRKDKRGFHDLISKTKVVME